MIKKILNIICLFLITFQINAGKEINNQNLNNKHLPPYYFHPVHISFTNIEYIEQKGKFEILFKFFVDDFNHILKNKYGKDLQLGEGKWDKSYPDIVSKYILEHFKFIVNQKDKTKSSLVFEKMEKSENSIWFYYNFNSKEKNNTFEIYNSFLNDLYIDQSNLLIFTFKGNQKAYKYSYDNVKEIFSF